MCFYARILDCAGASVAIIPNKPTIPRTQKLFFGHSLVVIRNVSVARLLVSCGSVARGSVEMGNPPKNEAFHNLTHKCEIHEVPTNIYEIKKQFFARFYFSLFAIIYFFLQI